MGTFDRIAEPSTCRRVPTPRQLEALLSPAVDSFNGVSCIEPSDELTEALRLLADGPQPAGLLPRDGLAELRELRWVMGEMVVELAGIGYYHTGPINGGLLG